MKIKKALAMVTLVGCISMALFGCAHKRTVTMDINGFEVYSLVEVPDEKGLLTCATTDDGLVATVNKDGDYDFVLEDEEGNNHTITLKCHNNTYEAEAEDGVSVSLSSK